MSFSPEIFEGRLERIPQRPLGEASDFVIDELPLLLEESRRGLIDPGQLTQDVDQMISNMNLSQLLALPPGDLDLAFLDLTMLEFALIHSGEEPNYVLPHLVTEVATATDQQPTLTYEAIILTNPETDLRLFTTGETAAQERDFYLGHRAIEGMFANATDQLFTAQKLVVENDEGSKASQLIISATSLLSKVVHITRSIGRDMDPEQFAIFRQYLGSNPYRDLPGPSGAFTAGIPIIELLLAGDKLSEEMLMYIDENQSLFPREGRQQIDLALNCSRAGNSIMSLVEEMGSSKTVVTDATHQLGNQLNQFRAMHYGAVKKQIPQALQGEESGTGGQADVRAFLKSRMNRYKV